MEKFKYIRIKDNIFATKTNSIKTLDYDTSKNVKCNYINVHKVNTENGEFAVESKFRQFCFDRVKQLSPEEFVNLIGK